MTAQIILADIASSQLFNAAASFIITRSANAEQACGIMFWLLGNLSGVRWLDVVLAIPTALVGIVLYFCYAHHPDAFSFGTESMISLDVPVKRIRTALVAAVTGMTAIMVFIVSVIGSVGLVIPYATCPPAGNQYHRLLSTGALTGTIFLIIADVISRILFPGQVLPMGVITALADVPAFSVTLIRGNQNK